MNNDLPTEQRLEESVARPDAQELGPCHPAWKGPRATSHRGATRGRLDSEGGSGTSLRRQPTKPRPVSIAYLTKLGANIARNLEPVMEHTEVARIMGTTKHTARWLSYLALGKMAHALRAAYPDGLDGYESGSTNYGKPRRSTHNDD